MAARSRSLFAASLKTAAETNVGACCGRFSWEAAWLGQTSLSVSLSQHTMAAPLKQSRPVQSDALLLMLASVLVMPCSAKVFCTAALMRFFCSRTRELHSFLLLLAGLAFLGGRSFGRAFQSDSISCFSRFFLFSGWQLPRSLSRMQTSHVNCRKIARSKPGRAP